MSWDDQKLPVESEVDKKGGYINRVYVMAKPSTKGLVCSSKLS